MEINNFQQLYHLYNKLYDLVLTTGHFKLKFSETNLLIQIVYFESIFMNILHKNGSQKLLDIDEHQSWNVFLFFSSRMIIIKTIRTYIIILKKKVGKSSSIRTNIEVILTNIYICYLVPVDSGILVYQEV